MRIFGRKWLLKSQVYQEMVVKITSSTRSKIEAVYFYICAGIDEITCGRKSRGDEKLSIDLEWPNTGLCIEPD